MKVLVYGAGVIGSYLTHVLCAAGNDVPLLARGDWRETLEQEGLTIVHHLQKKATHDCPHIIGALDSTHYDLLFAVMQYQQMSAILGDLARAGSPLVVLVGNNIAAKEMEAYIQAHTPAPKAVLFGFQGTGGRRNADKAICVRFGDMGMTVGGLHGEPSTAEKQALTSAFAGTKYRLTWTADMDAWYKCHLAFILPIVYLSYALDCNLRQATGKQVKMGLQAVREGYGLLSALGYPILPEDTMEQLRGFRGGLSYLELWIMAKTVIGELAATDHCRHAVTELEALDRGFMWLLLETDQSIAEIAGQVGYQNASKFSEVFRQFAGVTPSEYRKTSRPIGAKSVLLEWQKN